MPIIPWIFRSPPLRIGGSDNSRVNNLFLELSKRGPHPRAHGAKCDVRELSDGSITVGTKILTSDTAQFNRADVGKCVLLRGGGIYGAALRTKVAGYLTPTSVVLEDEAITTASSKPFMIATDDSEAFVKCWEYCLEHRVMMQLDDETVYIGRPEVYAQQPNVSFIATPSAGDGRFGIVGKGKYNSRIIYDEPTHESGDMIHIPFFRGRGSKNLGSNVATRLLFKDFTIRGTMDYYGDVDNAGDATDNIYMRGSGTFLVYSVDLIEIKNIFFAYIRKQASWLQSCRTVTIDGCTVWRSVAGTLAHGCAFVAVCNNEYYFLSDDCILVGSQGAAGMSDNDDASCHNHAAPIAVVANNRMFMTPGIKLGGAIGVTVVGNCGVFNARHGLQVATEDLASGGSSKCSMAGVVVANNVWLNPLDRSQISMDGAGGWVILLSFGGANPGADDAIPGNTDGTSVLPFYRYVAAEQQTADDPIASSFAIKITGNVIARTVDPVDNWSDYGFTFYDNSYYLSFDHTFQSDEAITEDALRPTGISIATARSRLMDISNNIVSGIGTAMEITANVSETDIGYSETIIQDNYFFDFEEGLDLAGGSTITPNKHQIVFRRNTWDGDPFYKRAGRNADGSWTSRAALLAISDNGIRIAGLTFEQETYRNVSSVVPAATVNDTYLFVNCLCEAQLTSFGDNAANKGMYNIPIPGASFRFRNIGCDPTSASTFGNIINECPNNRLTQPTAGTWGAQHRVWRDGGTVSSGRVALFDMRLTNGSGHVDNTDWQTFRAVSNPARTDGDNAFSTSQTITGTLTASRTTSGALSIADDAVGLITASGNSGVVTVHSPQGHHGAICWIANNTVTKGWGISSWTIATTGTDLTGTTGTDTEITISRNGGQVHIENRSGSAITVNYRVE